MRRRTRTDESNRGSPPPDRPDRPGEPNVLASVRRRLFLRGDWFAGGQVVFVPAAQDVQGDVANGEHPLRLPLGKAGIADPGPVHHVHGPAANYPEPLARTPPF